MIIELGSVHDKQFSDYIFIKYQDKVYLTTDYFKFREEMGVKDREPTGWDNVLNPLYER